VCSYNWVAREEFNLPGIGSVDDFTEQVRFGGSLTSIGDFRMEVFHARRSRQYCPARTSHR
jgi:hypothetical protein